MQKRRYNSEQVVEAAIEQLMNFRLLIKKACPDPQVQEAANAIYIKLSHQVKTDYDFY